MRYVLKLIFLVFFVLGPAPSATAGDEMIENFVIEPETRWRFFADMVMGGVSTGQVTFPSEDGQAHAHMTGVVSTQNNGGFIQIRMNLPDALPSETTGVRLSVRGNNQRYFVHLRTSGTVLPWQYYQAGFDVTGEWSEVLLPFVDFKASGRLLRSVPRPESLKSIAIVAYGRDHVAEIDVREVGFY